MTEEITPAVRTYTRKRCPTCGRMIGANGGAQSNHLRKHAKEAARAWRRRVIADLEAAG